MFGIFGLPALLILVVLGGIGAAFSRRGALAMSGPVLVLRKFEVHPEGDAAVLIEGRPSGLVAWLLTTIGLDTLTTLSVTDRQVSFRSASLSGELHHLVPTTEISSTHCGYSQPIWLLILGGAILVVSMLAAMNSFSAAQVFISGLFVAGICVVIYLLQRKIVITVETTGGMVMGLSFKPSAIENVSVSLPRALEAVARINSIVVAKSHASL